LRCAVHDGSLFSSQTWLTLCISTDFQLLRDGVYAYPSSAKFSKKADSAFTLTAAHLD